jgi:hypothetical protein
VESLLFDAFVAAAYRNDFPGRWKSQDAERWLVFLARHLEYTIGSADVAWWQLQNAAPRRTFGLVAGLVAGLVTGLLTGFVAGFDWRLVLTFGLTAALGFGLRFGSAKAPARGMRVSIRGLRAGLGFGLAAGLGLGLGTAIAAGASAGLAAGLVAGVGAGVVFALGFGLASLPDDLAGVTSPGTVLARDRQVSLLLILLVGLVVGLVAGVVTGVVGGLLAGVVTGLMAGLWAGLGLGLGLSMNRTAWPAYMFIRGWLALCHRLPWQLLRFFADAHRRGVLRQAGAFYQFRHIELQHRLATRGIGTDKQ